MKAALYARVSTKDQNSIAMQLKQMREYCKKNKLIIEIEFKEIASGAKDARPHRAEILKLARQRKIDVVVVWKLDRWGRSTLDLLSTLQELQAKDVGFISLTEALDLTTPGGRVMFGMMAVFAEFERELNAERVQAGIKAYREKNSDWGRPATARAKSDEVVRLKNEKLSNRKIAEQLGMNESSVRRILSSVI